MRNIALPGALLQSAAATALGATLAHFRGWGFGPGLIFGLALSIASTAVLMRALGPGKACSPKTAASPSAG